MKSLYDNIDSISTLPPSVSRTLAIGVEEQNNQEQMVAALQADGSISETLIRLAPTAFFGAHKEIHNLESGVTALGFVESRNIVIGKTIFTSFSGLEQNRSLDIGIFWEHAFTCGLAARIIAEDYGQDGSSFFIAGLVHDVGKLAMAMTFTKSYPLIRELSSSEYFYCTDQERAEFSISHDQVGLLLTRRWMLPEQLIMAAGYHHAPAEAPTHIHFPLVVQLADTLALLHDCSDVTTAGDVEKIFHDFLPELADLWQLHNTPITPALIGQWFMTLQEKRRRDQEILEILRDR